MKYALLFLTATILSAHANISKLYGEWGSGGGNSLVCFTDRFVEYRGNQVDIIQNIKENNNVLEDDHLPFISSIEFFDLYEAKKPRGFDSVKPEILGIEDGESYYDYFDRLGERFDKSVYRLTDIVKEAKALIPDSQFVFHDSAVEYQNDLGSVTLPSKKCMIITMAAQVNYNGFYEVHIDQRLFNHPKHSRQSKATLILHELVYAIGRKFYQHTDSGSTRNLIRYYISYHPSFTEGLIAKSVNELGFQSVNIMHGLQYQYQASLIMQESIIQIFDMIKQASRTASDIYSSQMYQKFFDEVRKQFALEELGDPNKYPKNFQGMEETLITGMGSTNNPSKWREFHMEFMLIVDYLYKTLREEADEELSDLRELMADSTSITKEELETYMKIVEHWNFRYLFADAIDLSEFYDHMKLLEDEGQFKHELFHAFLASTYGNEETVVGPLKLDNVIPR